jgi:aminopeptidase N
MNQTAKWWFILLVFTTLHACKTQKEIVPEYVITVEDPVTYEEELLDTLVVSAPIMGEDEEVPNEMPLYRASATRLHDLLHTRLDISFDWDKQHVLGKAELTLHPYFYPTDQLELDAKVFDIHSVRLDGKLLEYDYDFSKLKIKLDRTYTRQDTFTINIDYTAKPNEGPSSGSTAITSDKGLFFINPLNDNKSKPQQIWTQGETENSSRWFPTIDKPNERCSQEIFITVEERFKTLSNGVLISSVNNPDGTRTDYWKQDKPHAPYLFMVGVGEYAVVTDQWRDMPLMYYVEPAFEKDAEKIFNHTPEMLEFFSKKLNYEYPWDKYAQIVCRDYVSGAMENTGAVVFGEFVQKNSREFIDSNNDDIVAHEMFHHWFGDLVTCESWSNLSLNEGFATYSEYLWREYKYGHAYAEKKRLQDLNGYLMSSAQSGMHDLIDFKYDDKEAMFDAHSYNKGGLIVHMLRSYIGDDAFFAGLNRYLSVNEYTDVEAHELRLAFEDVTGEDLNWFFNQWFFDKGHPELDIDYDMDMSNSRVRINVAQTQDPEDMPAIFRFPVETALYYPSGKVNYITHWMDQREKEFVIDIEGPEMPAVVVFDGKHDILSVINEVRTEEENVQLFLLSSEYEDKLNAVKALNGTPKLKKILDAGLSDRSSEVRSLIVSHLNKEKHLDKLKQLALNDKSSAVRAVAMKKSGDLELAHQLARNDASFWVISEALNIISRKDMENAVSVADALVKEYHRPLISELSEIYANSGDASYLDFFEDNIAEVGIFSFFNFINQYGKLAKQVEDYERLLETAEVLKSVAMDSSNNYFKKYSATNLIKGLIFELESREGAEDLQPYVTQMKRMVSTIVQNSNDKRLRSSFQEYLQP